MTTTIEDSLQAIQSPKIRAITQRSATAFINLMAHQETELLDAMQEVEEGQKVNVAHALILDLERNQQKDRVSFSVKHSIECDGEIPDPAQLELLTEGGAQ